MIATNNQIETKDQMQKKSKKKRLRNKTKEYKTKHKTHDKGKNLSDGYFDLKLKFIEWNVHVYEKNNTI